MDRQRSDKCSGELGITKVKTRYKRLDSKIRTEDECILNSEPRTDEWGKGVLVFRGNFMLGRFFRGGKVRPGCFFPRGKIYTSIFFRGRFYPGAVFPGGKFYAGGGGNSMLQHRHCQRLALHMFLDGRFFPQVTYFHFAYAIGGRPFDSEGGGGGLAFCWNKYSDLENAENK